MALVPPHDLDAECAVLSALMLRGADALADLSVLAPTDFYSESHRRIFEAAIDLAKEHQVVDAVTVAARLRDRKRLEQVGGMGYLAGILDAAPAVDAKALRAYSKVVLDLSTLRQTLRLMQEAAAEAYARPEDVTAWMATVEKRVLALSTRTAASRLHTLREALFGRVRAWLDAVHNPEPLGTPMGFRDIDERLGRMHEGDLIIVGARPGMGKTALAMQVATNVGARGLLLPEPEAVVIFSLEMPREQLAGRVLCTHARLPVSRARTGRFSPHEFTRAQAACTELAKLNVFIDDAEQGRPSVHEIAQECRRLAADLARDGKRLRLVVIDYFQIIRLADGSAKQRLDIALGEISIALKQLAKELKLTVLALAQLSRGVEQRPDKRPMISDLRECGQLEQDADSIAFLYRDEYYNPEKTEHLNLCEVIVPKNRHGAPGTSKLRFDKQWVRFDDLAEAEPE